MRGLFFHTLSLKAFFVTNKQSDGIQCVFISKVAGNIMNFRINYHLRWWFIIHALHVDLLTFIIYYNRKHKRSYNGFNSFCLMIIPNRRIRLLKKRHNFYLVARSAQIISIIIITNYPVKFHAIWPRNS